MITDDTLSQKQPLADDLLKGAKEIAAFTGWSERQIFYMSANGQLRSIFTINRKLHARRSSLLREIQEFEAAGGR